MHHPITFQMFMEGMLYFGGVYGLIELASWSIAKTFEDKDKR
jgi:hypothetical protein